VAGNRVGVVRLDYSLEVVHWVEEVREVVDFVQKQQAVIQEVKA
jgi:hypothetical protein